jgi:hypothetical protein
LESDVGFPRETPELGYIVAAPQHRRRELPHRLLDALLNAVPGGLFATTDDDEDMIKTLFPAGFVRLGNE